MTLTTYRGSAPVIHRVRGYFAPVSRTTQTPALFDPFGESAFSVDSPPAPWIGLGWIDSFQRKATSKTASILTGVPAAALEQVRETLSAEVSLRFCSWTKLTMALATGSQHMNVLAEAAGAAGAAVGGAAAGAVSIQSGSSGTFIALASEDAARFQPGSMIAVDADNTGQTGYVGNPVSGGYLRQAVTDVNYIRRVTFNIGMVMATNSSGITLVSALPGGAPNSGMKIQAIVGFVDREGGSFYQEWSGLFIQEGSQGERVSYYYPRLQSSISAREVDVVLDERQKDGLTRLLLQGEYVALPVIDPLDGERVVCYRSYIPAVCAQV